MNAGVGNQNGLVGGFYMDHPKVRAGWLVSRQRWLSRWLRMPGKQTGFTVGFSLSHAERRTAVTPNHNIFAAAEVRPRNRIGRIAAKAGALFSTKAKFETTLYFEQAPNPESRVRLSDRRDRLGMPGLVLDWKYHADEQAAVVRFARRFADLALASGLANFIFEPADVDLRTASAANHPMGTTRMANDSSEGVVDRNCRVFGIGNLFIGGSSVFPTGGNANPTFTLLALARRLADHIASGLGQRSQTNR
jgi:choline dehydrogenase-like flavoprotein